MGKPPSLKPLDMTGHALAVIGHQYTLSLDQVFENQIIWRLQRRTSGVADAKYVEVGILTERCISQLG